MTGIKSALAEKASRKEIDTLSRKIDELKNEQVQEMAYLMFALRFFDVSGGGYKSFRPILLCSGCLLNSPKWL